MPVVRKVFDLLRILNVDRSSLTEIDNGNINMRRLYLRVLMKEYLDKAILEAPAEEIEAIYAGEEL